MYYFHVIRLSKLNFASQNGQTEVNFTFRQTLAIWLKRHNNFLLQSNNFNKMICLTMKDYFGLIWRSNINLNAKVRVLVCLHNRCGLHFCDIENLIWEVKELKMQLLSKQINYGAAPPSNWISQPFGTIWCHLGRLFQVSLSSSSKSASQKKINKKRETEKDTSKFINELDQILQSVQVNF